MELKPKAALMKPELGVQLRPCLRAEGFQRLSYFGAIHPQGDPNLGDRVILGDPCDPVGKAQRREISCYLCNNLLQQAQLFPQIHTNPTNTYNVNPGGVPP